MSHDSKEQALTGMRLLGTKKAGALAANIPIEKLNEEELNERVGEYTIQHTAEQVMGLMQEAGIAAGVVQNAKDIYEDPQLRQREFFWMMNHKEMGEFTHLGEPALLSRTPAKPRMPAPCLGEHTEQVCKEFLGMGDEEFVDHMISGAFGF